MPDADAPEEPTKRKLPLWLETVMLLTIAVVLALVIKTFFIQAFYIPSASMKPSLVENDRILVQKVSYWFGGTPQRGDVVVFKDPGGWLPDEDVVGPASRITSLMAKVGLYPSGGHLVKRVIGVAGDRIRAEWLVPRRRDALLAAAAVALHGQLVEHEPERLGTCASTSCGDAFADASPGAHRRFCSVTCQNRERVAAFRRRRLGTA